MEADGGLESSLLVWLQNNLSVLLGYHLRPLMIR
jgi:hypothetical protein